MATTVTNPDNFEVTLLIGYDKTITDADIAAVEATGARYLTHSVPGKFMTAIADDRRTTAIRGLAGVRYVQANSYGCVTSASKMD